MLHNQLCSGRQLNRHAVVLIGRPSNVHELWRVGGGDKRKGSKLCYVDQDRVNPFNRHVCVIVCFVCCVRSRRSLISQLLIRIILRSIMCCRNDGW